MPIPYNAPACDGNPAASHNRRLRRSFAALALIAPVLLLAVLVASCRAKSDAKSRQPYVGGDSSGAIHCLGRVLPGEKVLVLAAPPGSIVRDLLVRRRDHVKKGQVIVVFDRFAPADAAVREAEAGARAAQVELDRAQGEQRLAEIAAQEAGVSRCRFEQEKAAADMNRAERLNSAGSMSQDDLENASLRIKRAGAELDEAEKRLVAIRTALPADIASAESRLASAKAALDRARAEADLCVIRAPIDGVVIDINAWPGEAVGQLGVVDLGETDRMIVEAEVYINDVKRVSVGAPARVWGDGFAGEFTGAVAEVVGEVGPNVLYPTDPFSYADRRVVKVRIRLDDGARLAALSNAQVNVAIGP